MTQKQARLSAANEYWSYHDITKPVEIGLYYGFTPTPKLILEKQDFDKAKALGQEVQEKEFPDVSGAELFAILRHYFLKSPPPLPLMNIRVQTSPLKKDKKKIEYCLDIIGTNRSVADATVIQTAYTMLHEDGYEDLLIELNSLGDRDSFGRFVRELGAYFRKNMNELHPECRQALKKSPLIAIACAHEKCQPIKENTPHPMNYLSEPSRLHFKEVLELLETSELPYTINSTFIENSEFASHTIFKITGHEPGEKEPLELARGMRFANIAKRLGIKKDIPGMSAVICTKASGTKSVKKIPKPIFYLIQMGQDAKLRSLHVIEILRKAKIPVYHSLTKDKFAAQLASAENLKVPYVLIIGQKESIENTVLVRTMTNRSQETVKTDKLAEYLAKL